MKVNESQLWKWLREGVEDNIKKTYYDQLHWQRIENSIKANTPDVEGCFTGVGFVIELKSVERAAKIRCGLTSGQAMFLRARFDAGEASWLLIEVGGDKRYLISGLAALDCIKPITESTLNKISCVDPNADALTIFKAVVHGW